MTLLERVLPQEEAAATVSALLPLLRRIADATADTKEGLESAGVLATALLATGR